MSKKPVPDAEKIEDDALPKLASPVKNDAPETERIEVEALVSQEVPELEKRVVEAEAKVPVPPAMTLPVVVKLPTMVEEEFEMKPLVSERRLPKILLPEKVLLLERSVEDAAVMVKVPPAVIAVEFTVATVPVR